MNKFTVIGWTPGSPPSASSLQPYISHCYSFPNLTNLAVARSAEDMLQQPLGIYLTTVLSDVEQVQYDEQLWSASTKWTSMMHFLSYFIARFANCWLVSWLNKTESVFNGWPPLEVAPHQQYVIVINLMSPDLLLFRHDSLNNPDAFAKNNTHCFMLQTCNCILC